MKRAVWARAALILVVTILLAGCAKSDPIPQKADFSFPLPEGYSLADETEEDCAIADKDGRAVGGFAVTKLRRRDLKEKISKTSCAICKMNSTKRIMWNLWPCTEKTRKAPSWW